MAVSADSDRVFARRTLIATAIVLAAVVLVLVAWFARLAWLVIYLSLLVSAGARRPVDALQALGQRHGRRVPRWLVAIAIYMIVLSAIAGLLVLTCAPLVAQIDQLWAGVPGQFNRFQDILRHYGVLARRVTIQEAVQSIPQSDAIGSMKSVLTIGSTFARALAGVVSVIILSFYITVSGTQAAEWLGGFAPAHLRPALERTTRIAISRIGHWIEATAIIGALMGSLTFVIMSVVGVPYPYVVAFVAACGESVPLVGPLLAGGLAILAALTVSPQLALGTGVAFAVLHELEANVFVPRITEARVGVSPIAVMCGLLIGWELAGVFGAVLAIPTVTLCVVVAEQWPVNGPLSVDAGRVSRIVTQPEVADAPH